MMTSNIDGPQQDLDLLKQLAKDGSMLIGQFKLTSKEILDRLAQNLTQQRVQALEHRAEGAKALEYLKSMDEQGKAIQLGHQKLVKSIETQWPQRMDEAATAAGQAQAEAFGERIAAGIQSQIADAADQAMDAATQLQAASRGLRWRVIGLFTSALFAFGLVVALFIWAWWIDSASTLRARQAFMSELSPALTALQRKGGKLDLQECPGDPLQRMCVRIDRNANLFGQQENYAVVATR